MTLPKDSVLHSISKPKRDTLLLSFTLSILLQHNAQRGDRMDRDFILVGHVY